MAAISSVIPRKYQKDVKQISESFFDHRSKENRFYDNDIHKITDDIIAKCNWDSGVFIPIASSLMDIVGKPISNSEVRKLAFRIVFNKDNFHKGGTLLDRPPTEKVDLICVNGLDFPEPEFHFMVLSGPGATEIYTKTLSMGYFKWLLRNSGGLFREETISHPRRLFNFEMRGTMKRNGDKVSLSKIHSTDKQRRRNGKIRRERNMKRRGRCRNQEMTCIYCPIGVDKCYLSTHMGDWKIKECNIHGKAWHDSRGCTVCRIGGFVLKTEFEID